MFGINIKSVKLLGTNQHVAWTQSPDGLNLTIPAITGDNAITFKVDFE